MGDVPSDELRARQIAACRLADWEDVTLHVICYAKGRRVPQVQAEDLVQSAILRVCEGKTLWDPDEQPIALFLMDAVQNDWRHLRDKRRKRAQTPAGLMADSEATTPDDPTSPEAEEARAAEGIGRVRDALAGDRLAIDVFELVLEGVDKAADQATRLGAPVGKVYDARDRIGRHAKRIAKEYAEEQRKEVAE